MPKIKSQPNTFANVLHLQLLVYAVLAGLIAGPFTLGKVAPGLYARLFVSTPAIHEAQDALDQFDARTELIVAPFYDTDLKKDERKKLGYLPDIIKKREVNRKPLVDNLDRSKQLAHMDIIIALLAVMIILMVMEIFAGPEKERKKVWDKELNDDIEIYVDRPLSEVRQKLFRSLLFMRYLTLGILIFLFLVNPGSLLASFTPIGIGLAVLFSLIPAGRGFVATVPSGHMSTR